PEKGSFGAVATASREVDIDLNRSTLRNLLEDKAQCVRFFQAVRLLAEIFPDQHPVGRFSKPGQEVVRFVAHPSTSFPASEIQSLDLRSGPQPRMEVNFMGLTGPQGELPLSYTELVMERIRARDPALRDFLDLFNHRMISLFYQAWERSHFAVESGVTDDRLSQALLAIIGLATAGLPDRQSVPDFSLLHYAGLFASHTRSAVGLEHLLGDYFSVPVEIIQFFGAWHKLDLVDQTCFDREDSFTESLGAGATLGDEVWDEQSGVCIRIGPLELTRYLDFLPVGDAYRELRSLVRFYFNDQLDFRLQLVLKRESTPKCELGQAGECGPRLGWVTWVSSTSSESDPDQTILPL
ncbi:MAG TPA: type VI secretion system baseplate subunit TssG, partial [Terriglobales bacterium]